MLEILSMSSLFVLKESMIILVCEQPLIRQGTRGYDVTQEGITCRPLNLFNHYCEILTSLLGLDRALTEAVLPKWLTSSDQSQDEGS